MHLNECFELAFSRPATGLDGLGLSAMGDASSARPQQTTVGLAREGSVLSVLQCILSDWGSKSQTNFYIPPERYAGYSYLFDDTQEQGEHNFDTQIRQHAHHNARSHAHDHFAFVNAEEPNNLHPHHYDLYAQGGTNSTHLGTIHSTTYLNELEGHITVQSALHHSPIFTSQIEASTNTHAPMTVPYIHPHLEMPVPPLLLPWYFGALCFSFTFGGIVMLSLPPRWVRGGRESGEGHWFFRPYYVFAWGLTLVQGPCSFLADYVNMTNISIWHIIDRFMACSMMSLEIAKLTALRPYTRPFIYLVYLTCCGGAAFCFLKSQEAQQALDRDAFVFWHNGWHLYPIVQTFVLFVELFLNRRWGEYYAFDSETDGDLEGKYRTGPNGGVLLSTIVMKYWSSTGRLNATKQSFKSTDDTDQKICSSSPGVRRSRRIAGRKPEIQHSL